MNMIIAKAFVACVALAPLASLPLAAETVVDVNVRGAQKISVAIKVANPAYAKCLKKNLELSGLFTVGATGAITVTGGSGGVRAQGLGKGLSATTAFADDKSARMAARKFSDAMCEAFGKQKGFACDKVIFLDRGKLVAKGQALPSELCMSYPDGMDIRKLTSDGKMTIFPRWMPDGENVVYLNDKNGAPQVWQMNVDSLKRGRKFSFKGTPTSIAPSPDGRRFALTLSFQGNVELYVADPATDRLTRLTTTKFATEGQPTWSPDGRQIAYVSDETRTPQIYVIDVATKAKRRLTSKGSQNVDPDWGPDGKITYITKRGGSQVAVMDAATGDASSVLVTEPANWRHPSWSRDGRHLTAARDQAIFVIDTLEGGDKPRQMFYANGNWVSPCWTK
jgi:tol-pal system beta propeller repeat protein TolB